MGVFLDQVPFVDQNNHTFVVAVGQPKDILHLAIKSTGSVDNQKTDIGIFDGANGTHYRIKLNVFFDLGFAAYSGRIDQFKIKPKTVVNRIDTVSSSSGHIGNDIAFFADKGVDQGRFSGVGASNHRKTG